jgi:hypothetical protein
MSVAHRFLLIGLLAFVFTGTVFGQAAGGLSGVVSDPSGAVVSDAAVTATNIATGATRTVQTGDSGAYSVSPLPVGQYKLDVRKPGFKTLTRSGIVIDINSAITLDLSLQVGQQTENVTVTDVPPTIDTENQELGNLRLPEQIQNLPIIVREVQTLVGQTPGVPYGTGSKTSSDTDTIGGTFSQGRAEQQVLADGAQLNPFQTTGYPAIDGIGRRAELTMPNVAMIHEFRLVTNGGSAEYGNPVAILVATKAGSNSYHGDMFETYQSGGLAAKFDILGVNPASVPSPSFVRHQFGGSIGGPLIKDKLLFQTAFEEFSHVRIETNPARFPTDAERSGDLSGLLTLSKPVQLYDPVTRNPIPNNRLDLDPNTPISPVTAALLAYVPHAPAPTPGSAFNGTYSKPEHDISQKYDARLDYTLGPKNILFARATIGHIDQAFTYSGTIPGDFGLEVKNYYTQLITGTYTRILSPNFLLKTTVSHRNEPFKNTPTQGGTVFPVPIAGLTPKPPFAGPPAVTIGSNALAVSTLTDRRFLNFSNDNDWQFNPALNWTIRTHSIVAGVFYLHGNKTSQFASAPWGQYATASDPNNRTSTVTSVTGDAFADYLLGYPSSTDVTVGPSGGYLTKQNVSAYVQDNWKITPNLTVNLGIRYDNYGFFRPSDQRYANADVNNGKIVIPDGSSDLIQPAFQPFVATFEPASSLGLNNSLTYSNSYAFVPRLGVAYRLWKNTAVRGGFGIYNNDVNNNYLGDGINSPPFTFRSRLTRNLIHSSGIPDSQYTFSNPTANGSTASAATTLASFGGWNPHYPVNQAYEYNLTVEKQLGSYAVSVSYAGNYQNALSRTVETNACVPGPTACSSRTASDPTHRRYLQFGLTFGQQAANGTSNYNALFAEVTHRFHSGFSFDVNYAHSRLFTYQAVASNPVVDPLWHYDYGPVQAQPYDVFHYNHVIELPFGRDRRVGSHMNRGLDAFVGGWKLAGVGTWQSGQPLTVTGGSTQSPTGATSNRANRVCDGRGQQPGSPGIPHSGTWFNTACYTLPDFVPGATANRTRQFGTAGIGTVIGPGVVSYDANLQKAFTLWHESVLTVRLDGFNLFNHPLIAAPNLDVTGNANSYGHTTTIVSTYQPRQFQIGARYSF